MSVGQDHQKRHLIESKKRLLIAERLIDLLWREIRPASVLDVGCGLGFWLKAFQNKGVGDLCGVEGDWLDPKLALAQAKLVTADLAQPLSLGRLYDLVVSIEVAEHIAKESAGIFIKSLVTHGDVILFSAAIRGQGGQGHVNEQYLQYWVDRFAGLGYRPFDLLRPLIWQDNEIYLHLRQNLVLFANDRGISMHPRLAHLDGIPALISVIHPEYYDRELKARMALLR